MTINKLNHRSFLAILMLHMIIFPVAARAEIYLNAFGLPYTVNESSKDKTRLKPEIWNEDDDNIHPDTKEEIIENGSKVKELYFYEALDNCSSVELTRTYHTSDCYAEGGELKAEISYRNGKRNGPIKKYFINGATEMVGTYKDDKMNGKVTFYYPSGKIYRQFNTVNDKIDGKYIENDEDGRVLYVKNYKNGVLDGLWGEYGYDDGKRYVILEKNYKDGKLNGKFKGGNELGIMEQGTYKDGKLTGTYELFAVEGVLNYDIVFDDNRALSGNIYCHSASGVQDWAIKIPWNPAQILNYNRTKKIPSCPENWDEQGNLIVP